MLSLFASGAADLEHSINQLSVNTVYAATALLLALVVISMWSVRKRKKHLHMPLFISMMVVIISTTLTISASTVYLNVKSATGGPVHWHADVEVWACGNEIELRDPTGFLSNKIGTATLHEHDDKRIHLEGVPVELPYDASLGKFMNVIGGQIAKDTLVVPVNDEGYFEDDEDEVDGDGDGASSPEQVEPFIKSGSDGKYATFVSGELCDGQPSDVQVFVYSYDDDTKTYKQSKLEDPANYAISQESQVPSGDCVIFEFGPNKERTERLCEQYGVRDQAKCARFGVDADKREICEITEVY
jgi:hypothetical protein